MKRKLALLGCSLLTLSLSPSAFAASTLGTSYAFNGFATTTGPATNDDTANPIPNAAVVETGDGGSFFYFTNGSASDIELNTGGDVNGVTPAPLNYLQYNFTRAGGDTDSYADTVTFSTYQFNTLGGVLLTNSILYSENNGATWTPLVSIANAADYQVDQLSGTINVPSGVNNLEVQFAISNDGNFRSNDADIFQFADSFVGTPGPAVPEPSTWALMLCGLVLVARFARKGLKNGLSS